MSKRKFINDDDIDVALEHLRSKKYKWDTPVFSETLSEMQVEAPKKRVPKHEWFNAKSPEDQKKWVEQQLAKTSKRKSGRKPAAKRRRAGSTGGGGGRGTNIIYPNVIGRGAYYIGGSLGYDSEKGWQGGAKAYYTDQDTVQGLGGYNVRRNSLMSAVDLGQDPPRVANTNRGEATVINHREYLGDLFSGAGTPSNFSLQKYELNPGNSNLFPFLSSIARQFQEYEIRGMLIELKSLSSEYASNLALGSYFMAADYNVYGNDPATKQQLENMEYASSAKPSKSMIMPIECDPSNNVSVHKNVAINSEYHTGDKRLYDWANVYVGSQGIPQANTPLAEIWLTYEIALFKPIISGNDHHHVTSQWDCAMFRLVNCSNEHPLGNQLIPFDSNSPDITLRFTGSGDIYTQPILDLPDLPAGHADVYYQVTLIVDQDGISTMPPFPDMCDIDNNGGATTFVTNLFPRDGVASSDSRYEVIEKVGTTRLKMMKTRIVKRTGFNTGGGKSEGSLGFTGAEYAPDWTSSVGLLILTALPGTFVPQ